VTPQHETFLARILRSYTGVLRHLRLEADDVAQEVRLRLWRRPMPADVTDPLAYTILRRQVQTLIYEGSIRPGRSGHTGEKNRFQIMPYLSDVRPQDPADFHAPRDPWLATHVARLPPHQQQILHDVFWEGDLLREAGQKQGRSMQWAHEHKHTALKTLRQAMGGEA